MKNQQEIKQMDKNLCTNSDKSTFQKVIMNYFRLIRLDSPTGYLLSFFPAAFGLLLAYEDQLDFLYLPLFMIGSILTRGAGCVINDLLDKDFDRKVHRTKNRPIANGDIPVEYAIIFLTLILFAALSILLLLPLTSIVIGFVAFFLICLYPLMKRVTYFPQAFLGVTFNMGALIGYSAVKDSVSSSALILYVACGLWTFSYDTIYAFMDIKDESSARSASSGLPKRS